MSDSWGFFQGILDKEVQLRLFILVFVVLWLKLCLGRFTEHNDGLSTVGRAFALEPSLVTRIRFAFKSREILTNAYQKYNGKPYRIVRGDTHFVVLPAESITELNRLPQRVLNSRQCHAFSLVGHLNSMDVVLHTDFHVRVLLGTITPLLPLFIGPASLRMKETMKYTFPQDTDKWATVNMIDASAAVAGRAIALAVVGAPLCDNSAFMNLINKHTEDVFLITFVMRFFPECLQSTLVWLLPTKWRFGRSQKEIEHLIATEAERQKSQPTNLVTSDGSPLPTLFTCMKESKKKDKLDAELLTRLLAALSAGGTYSVANFIFAFILDMTAHPHFLEELRAEIHQKHEQINGEWNFEALNDLPKMDSAFKETMRLTPGSLTTYSRVVQQDYQLSSGLTLRKGQFVCVDSSSRAANDDIYSNAREYDAMRAYNSDLEGHLAQPFKGVYGTDFRWGAGRWACSGRYLASILIKWMAVKLLDEYEFQIPGGNRPENWSLHEYVFVHPGTQIKMRRRKESLDIQCV
ncbi:cytochrome P450 [Penicillium verhagenii]|uniref:cytochrome P450 n=1 Tax=Penicillium verhagenii TaxID=1562060 RepID=UPI002544D964|nr:cytochrome P450 [Penicillium verhagenii]KAJ5921348.1 cytochrome P450 [Penicillium verhagenii]